MATTSVHLSPDLLHRLDERAQQQGVSRNRLIRTACEQLLTRGDRRWPVDFVDPNALDADDMALLTAAGHELDQRIAADRTRRSEPPF